MHFYLALLSVICYNTYILSRKASTHMIERWSTKKINEWYAKQPWLRGCNFMGSDCANRIDQWQSLGFEERLITADRELALAAETGMNTIRIILEYIVWRDEHDGFMERFERYLATAARHGISCMVVFGNDCMPPKTEGWRPLQLGEQPCDWGYHGGRKNSQHGTFNLPGYHLLDEPEEAERHYEWVREIITRYKDDPASSFGISSTNRAIPIAEACPSRT